MSHHSPGCSYASQEERVVINRGLGDNKDVITMHHDVYLGCIDRWQQHGLQQRLNARYNVVTELLLCCHSTVSAHLYEAQNK